MKIYNYLDVEPSEEAPGVEMRTVIGDKQGAPRFAMRLFEIKPGCSSPFHTHWWEHEVFVLSGKGRVRSEMGETEIQGESVAFIEPNEKHSLSNIGDDLLRFICVIPLVEKGSH